MANCIKCGSSEANEYLFAEVQVITNGNTIQETLTNVFSAAICMNCLKQRKRTMQLISLGIALVLIPLTIYLSIYVESGNSCANDSFRLSKMMGFILIACICGSISCIIFFIKTIRLNPVTLADAIVKQQLNSSSNPQTIYVLLEKSVYNTSLSDDECKKEMNLSSDLALNLRDAFILSVPNNDVVSTLLGMPFYAQKKK